MFTVALLISLACLGLVVATFIRMIVTARQTRAEIIARPKTRWEYGLRHNAGEKDQ